MLVGKPLLQCLGAIVWTAMVTICTDEKEDTKKEKNRLRFNAVTRPDKILETIAMTIYSKIGAYCNNENTQNSDWQCVIKSNPGHSYRRRRGWRAPTGGCRCIAGKMTFRILNIAFMCENAGKINCQISKISIQLPGGGLKPPKRSSARESRWGLQSQSNTLVILLTDNFWIPLWSSGYGKLPH